MNADALLCFDAIASDARWHGFAREERRVLDDFARRWQIQPGQHILEPGCGTGRLTAILAKSTGPTGRVVSFDASPASIAIASRRQLPAHVQLSIADAATVALPAGAFDHVICLNVFPHLVPLRPITRRLVASLKPGGIFWIAHTSSRVRVNRVHRDGPPSLHDHLLPDAATLSRLLRAAGLRSVTVEDRIDCYLAWGIRR